MKMSPMWLIDWYKNEHVWEYPEDSEYVVSNFTPRSTHVLGDNSVVFFGLQYFIKEILIKEWNENFFNSPLKQVISEYKEVVASCLGNKNPRTSHLEALHKLRYLPLEI